jgi:hypothetical protein
MCSCKTKKIDSHEKTRSDIRSDISYLNENVKIDTTRNVYSYEERDIKVVYERIKTTKYDKDTGTVTEETLEEREIRQGNKEVSSNEARKGIVEENHILVKQVSDFTKTSDSEKNIEETGGEESFGKWLGIVTGCFIVLIALYIIRKLRVN